MQLGVIGLGRMGGNIARRLIAAGHSVVVFDKSAEAVAAKVRETGSKSVAIVADALDASAVAGVVDQCERDLGGLDILVTVIGSSKLAGILEKSLEEWDADMNVNLRYVVAYTQAVARSFIQREVKGSIVAISTGAALRSMPYRPGYGASKAALVHLIKSLATELGQYGIRINSVAPGATFTPNSVGYMDTDAFKAEIAKIPLGRLALPEDIARGVTFLASDMARHVTGTTLAVDGGFMSA